MAASEDQTEPIILNLILIEDGFVDPRLEGSKISLCSVEARTPADPVDGLEARR